MPDTKKQQPGHVRLVRTLMEVGAARQLAYDLGEDARAMVASAVSDKLDELKTVLTRRIDDQGKRIEDQGKRIEDHGKKIDDQGKRITALETAVNAQNVSIEAQSVRLGAIESVLKQLRRSLERSESRQTKALEASETRQAEAMKVLEARLAAPYNRLVDHLVKFLWGLFATVVLAVLTVIANQVKQLLGF